MGTPNFENRTLYYGDNLPALRRMNNETVHLIATDPPFKKQRGFFSDAGGYDDRWTWQKDILGLDRKGNAIAENHDDWIDQIQDDWPGAWKIIDTARTVYGDDMGAFLCWLGVRLMEMHRILRDDGSIYLHIDHTAHAWVKALMDAIFGKENFRNEIVWCYEDVGGRATSYFKRKHDTILAYQKSKGAIFNIQRKRLSDSTIKRYSKYFDENGQITYRNLQATNPGVFRKLKGIPDDLDRVWLDINDGSPLNDWWSDISAIKKGFAEFAGYPTQKPLALYERIIQASTNPGDIVLDPFCGCATTPVAAERLGRWWVGMDIWEQAYGKVTDRLRENGILVDDPEQEGKPNANGMLQFTEYRLNLIDNKEKGEQFPARTDDNETAAPVLRLKTRRPTEPWQQLSNALMRRILIVAQGRNSLVGCAGCGRLMEPDFFHLDHISPKSEGGENYITNRILICAPCNSRKSNTSTLTGLQRGNRREGWMKDRKLAEEMQSLARMRAEWIRDGWGTEQCQEFIDNLD